MAEHLLDVRAQFPIRAMILDHLEERIVSKAVRARGLKADAAMAHAVTFGTNDATWIGYGNVANIMCGAFLERTIAEIGQ